MNSHLRVTLVQSDLAWRDPAENRRRLAAHFRGLAGHTDLVVLPEMFSTGFCMDSAALAEPMDGPTVGWMREEAAATGCAIAGSLIVRDGDRHHNRLVWARPDGALAHYDKRHLFRMAGEHEHFAAGSARLVADLKGWRVCPLVCYDLRFPVWSRGADAFDLMLYVANWPAARRSAWRALLPARAVENQCYVAGVNRTGSDGQGIAYAGDSTVHDYLGQCVADLGAEPGTVSVTLDRAALHRYREKFPAWRDADPFQLL